MYESGVEEWMSLAMAGLTSRPVSRYRAIPRLKLAQSKSDDASQVRYNYLRRVVRSSIDWPSRCDNTIASLALYRVAAYDCTVQAGERF